MSTAERTITTPATELEQEDLLDSLSAEQLEAMIEGTSESLSASEAGSLESATPVPAIETDQAAQESEAKTDKPRIMAVSYHGNGDANMFGFGAQYIATSLNKRGNEIEVKTAQNGIPYVTVPKDLVPQAMGIAKSAQMDLRFPQSAKNKAEATQETAAPAAEASKPAAKETAVQPPAKPAATPEMSQAEMALVVAMKNLLQSGGDRVDSEKSVVAFGMNKQGEIYVVDKRIGERGMVIAKGDVAIQPNGQVKVNVKTDLIAEANAKLAEGTKQHDWSKAYAASTKQIEVGIASMQKPQEKAKAAGRE